MTRIARSIASCILLSATVSVAAAEPQAAPGFVPNHTCAECHRDAFEAWRSSHHDQAMQEASADTVLGDFDDARFELHGVTTRFFRKGDGFFVNTEGPDGALHDYPVRYTFGVDPLQQYLVPFPGGRVQALTIAWDTERRRWYSLYPDERIAPGDALHWTGVYQNWNAMCAECHSTNLREGYDVESDTFETTFSEIDVSCQACHGPGSAHVAWARAKDGAATEHPPGNGLVVNFAGGDSRYQVEQCARCHSRRDRASPEDAHGRAFMDDFFPVTLRPDLYHADGQIDGEVYVYGSFLQSRMYASGVRCTDCHDAHSQRLKVTDNGLCTRCHQASPDLRFPGLEARNYDDPAHHFHPLGSEAARCVSCHMPGKVYMGVDHRRDHSFRVPRPDVTRRAGTPNACNACHDDRTPAWAAAAIRERAGGSAPARHYGETIAAARRGDPAAGEALAALAEDTTQPAIVRATALELLGGHGRTGARALARALSDPEPVVRLGSLRGIEPLPPRVRVAGAVKVLQDPARAVRGEAARVLAAFPAGDLPAGVRGALARARHERLQTLRARASLPGGRLALAVRGEADNDDGAAERHYRKALDLDRRFLPARFNLASLLNRRSRNAEAAEVLRAGIRQVPDEGELHYSLGLLLAEEERYPEAVESLGRAATLLPRRGRVHYNLALALARVGRSEASLASLQRAVTFAPGDPSVLEALAGHHFRREAWDDAERYGRRWLRAAPDPRGARRMLRQIEALRTYGVTQ
jgi:predicted CXXCH cytochrome family protein